MYKHHQISKELNLWTSHTPHKDIVTIMGMADVELWHQYSALELELWVDMLEKGSDAHDKIAMARALESLGAQVSFSMVQGSLCWTAQCLKKDVSVMYRWLNEMIFSSSFPEEEIKLWLKLSLSETKEELSDPQAQSSIAFNRLIYPSSHPMRCDTTDEQIHWMTDSSAEDVVSRIRSINIHSVRVMVVGDIEEQEHVKSLSQWPVSPTDAKDQAEVLPVSESKGQREHIEISDKTSLDVRLGQSLSMDVHHEDYWPLLIAVDALGGTFSARLMQTVRDVEGLTYGVNSNLHSLLPGYGGYFSVVITLAPVNLEKGIASTQFQIKKWWDDGVSADELKARKRGLLGRHAVRSTKTTQIAALMRHGLMHGFDVDYASLYADKIESVTLDQVNSAIRKWISLDKIMVVSSGSK